MPCMLTCFKFGSYWLLEFLCKTINVRNEIHVIYLHKNMLTVLHSYLVVSIVHSSLNKYLLNFVFYPGYSLCEGVYTDAIRDLGNPTDNGDS